MALGIAVLLVGCGGGVETTAPQGKPPTSTETSPKPEKTKEPLPDVEWEDYAPTVKARIDRLAKGKKCGGLQHEFGIADQNSDATMARTGHSNANLMIYIDAQLQAAGCYA